MYTGKQGRPSEHLGTCSMGQMACPSEPRQTQQGTSILGKPGSTSELVLWPMWPVPRNPTGLPVLFAVKHLGTCPMAHLAYTSEPNWLACVAQVPRITGKPVGFRGTGHMGCSSNSEGLPNLPRIDVPCCICLGSEAQAI